MDPLNTLKQRVARPLKRALRPRIELDGSADYLEAYRADTDARVERNPRDAIGGLWEELGTLQFEFLVGQGLQPAHRMLDIGCGTLRGGRHFIRYLEPGGYTGIDISAKAILYAHDLVGRERLGGKRPRLLLNTEKHLQFTQFQGECFDVLLAQSVFTHLKPEHIRECFAHIGRVMGPASRFFFPFLDAPTFTQPTPRDFRQPASFYRDLAQDCGFELGDLSEAYKHPRGQRMAVVQKRATDGG